MLLFARGAADVGALVESYVGDFAATINGFKKVNKWKSIYLNYKVFRQADNNTTTS